MAVNPIYRESWKKANGWNVRVEFIAGGGQASRHDARSVTNITGVYRDVSSHKASFSDGLPMGMADGESCKFVLDYEAAPLGMQTALTAQYADVDASYFATATEGKYRTPKLMPQAVTSVKPKQPNLFMVWSDRGTSNGVVTGLDIAYGGTAWEFDDTDVPTDPYFPGAMDTRIGAGLTIDYEVVGGVITTVHVNNGGTGYSVGQQVKVEDPLVEGRYAYFTITSVQAPTWYIEFMGCQRISPSTKYKVDERGLEIEIEAIGIHKICLESITDLTTYSRSYINEQTDSTSGGNYYNAPRYAQDDITDFHYYYNGFGFMRMQSSSKLTHWHASLGSLFGYLDAAFNEAFEFFSMEGYALDYLSDASATNIASVYPTTTSKLKIMRAKLPSLPYTSFELGTSDGDMHTTAAELTELRFIFAVTEKASANAASQSFSFQQPKEWVGGLMTDVEDGYKADADSAWDFLRKLCEQFFIKLTPKYEYVAGALSTYFMRATWNINQPYSTSYSISSIDYAATTGDAAFEANAETREAVKLHNLVEGDNNDTVELTSYSKSGKKIEINNIFDVRYRTVEDGTEIKYTVSSGEITREVVIPYANLRGLFQIKSPSSSLINNFRAGLVAVSPAVQLSYITTGTTDYTLTGSNPYYYTTDRNDPNYALYAVGAPYKVTDPFCERIRELQTETYGFALMAMVLLNYFGVPADITDPTSTSEFESNNQTIYEMSRPLGTSTLAYMLGQRTDITPHSALLASISDKAYATDVELNWTCKDSSSDLVKIKYLTRSIKHD